MAVEVAAAVIVHCLALLRDAGHALTDADAIGLSLIAVRPGSPHRLRAATHLRPNRHRMILARSLDLTPTEKLMATAAPKSASKTTLDALRHPKHYQPDADGKTSPYAGGSSFMERVAEGVASGMGTVAFVVIGSAIILGWVLINGAIPYFETTFKALSHGGQFDREPWILLNLIFSGVAFYTGALVIIAQKAQTRTDVANEAAAAAHRDELAQFQTELLQQNTTLTQEIDAVAKKLATLIEEVHNVTCKK